MATLQQFTRDRFTPAATEQAVAQGISLHTEETLKAQLFSYYFHSRFCHLASSSIKLLNLEVAHKSLFTAKLDYFDE
jgi:hypothetical protein